jgi:hypothetical protein
MLLIRSVHGSELGNGRKWNRQKSSTKQDSSSRFSFYKNYLDTLIKESTVADYGGSVAKQGKKMSKHNSRIKHPRFPKVNNGLLSKALLELAVTSALRKCPPKDKLDAS